MFCNCPVEATNITVPSVFCISNPLTPFVVTFLSVAIDTLLMCAVSIGFEVEPIVSIVSAPNPTIVPDILIFSTYNVLTGSFVVPTDNSALPVD